MGTNARKTVLSSFKEYMKAQLDEIFSPFNKWVTGEKVNHPPSEKELAKNYVDNGGPERFAETHTIAGDDKDKREHKKEQS